MSKRSGLAIDSQSRVDLNFALSLEDGSVVDSNLDQPPCSFNYGDGSLLPGVEQSLLGMKAGEQARITLSPQQAFGDWQADRVQSFPRQQFDGYELQRGLVISFADPSGERPGTVSDFNDTTVSVDFNHPLAGRTLLFEVHIHSVN